MGMDDENNVWQIGPRNTEQVEQIRHRRMTSLMAQINKKKTSAPFNQEKVDRAKKSFVGYEIADLERIILQMTYDWKNVPETWFGIAELLEQKYTERDSNQLD